MGFYTDRSIQASEITPKEVFENRRTLLKTAAAGGFGLFSGKVKTAMFNGYEEQVAHLYAGMDLKKYY